jgi:hypothetical protein
MRRRLPTAPLAAAGLIGAYAVVVASGSKPLGGAVLVLFGALCVWISSGRDSLTRTALLVVVGGCAFILSHLLGPLIGDWPAVLLAATGTAVACWRLSDAPAQVRFVARRLEGL